MNPANMYAMIRCIANLQVNKYIFIVLVYMGIRITLVWVLRSDEFVEKLRTAF